MGSKSNKSKQSKKSSSGSNHNSNGHDTTTNGESNTTAAATPTTVDPATAKKLMKKNMNKKKKKMTTSTSSSDSLTTTELVCILVSLLMGILSPPAYKYLTNSQAHLKRIVHHAQERHKRQPYARPPSHPDSPVAFTVPFQDDACSQEALSSFLHDEPVMGMHVICIAQDFDQVQWFPLAYKSKRSRSMTSIRSAIELQQFLLEELKNRRHKGQPWGMFDQEGRKVMVETTPKTRFQELRVEQQILESNIVLVMEGGQWIWPGVREGFVRKVNLRYLPGAANPNRNILDNHTMATIVTLSLHPLVFSVEGFLSEDECDYIQQHAAPTLKYSKVTLKDNDQDRADSDFRTSQSTFLVSRQHHPVMTNIDDRTASLVRIPVSHQEHVQVLRYGHLEKYDAHHDFFDPSHYQNDPSTLKYIQHGARNRLATVFWYLTDVARGGETIFPRYKKMPTPRSYSDCDLPRALKVKPQRGKVIIFYSLQPDGGLDQYSLHGACPVLGKDDVKWAANQWVWSQAIM